jgi:DNA-binding FadR family transcriptional regulator
MIYEAVTEGDLEAAEQYSRQHIRRVRRYMTLTDQNVRAEDGNSAGE